MNSIINVFPKDNGAYIIRDVDRVSYYNSTGKLHREDGPSVILFNGDRFWYKDGKKHRDNGPSVEYFSGTKKYYKYNKLHREDGPAIEIFDGPSFWFLDDKEYSEEQYNRVVKLLFII